MAQAHDTKALPTLALSDGGFCAQIAAAIAAEDAARAGTQAVAQPLIAAASIEPIPANAVAEAVSAQAESLGLKLIPLPGVPRAADPSNPLEVARAQTMLLTTAAYAAAELGCRRLVWPIQLGPSAPTPEPGQEHDLDAIATAIDRALLVSRIANLDADRFPVPDITIDTPFVDLADTQVAELAADMRLTTNPCWFNTSNAVSQSQDARQEAARWRSALDAIQHTHA